MAVNRFQRAANELFGQRVKRRRDKYYDIRMDIVSSRIATPYDIYISSAQLWSIIVGAAAFMLCGFLIWLFGPPEITLNRIILPSSLAPYLYLKPILTALGFLALSLIFCGGGTYLVFLSFPRIMVSTRRVNIDATLPYAVNFMAAMSGAGVIPLELFKSLAKSPIYGESAVEARYIVRDVEVLGRDLITAMHRVAISSPSQRFQEFIQGAIAVSTSGGDLGSYFATKSEQYMIENRREQRDFLEVLGLIAETYVTAFVAAPLFLIVMISVMCIMGSSNIMFLYILVYAVIPVGSLLYIIMINSLTPEA